MPVVETLLDNKSKFESILVGVDFSATDSDFIDRLVGVPNAFVAKNRPGCFHPKIFYFQSGASVEAIVGSANLTAGGLSSNLEASVHVKGAADDTFFAQVRDQLARYRPLHLPITKSLAESYRRQSKAAGSSPRPRNPILPGEAKDWARINSPLATMSWKEFVEGARQDTYYKKRMTLVRAIQRMFSKAPSLRELSVTEWKGIAGVLGDPDWGLFGSMNAAGTFTKLIGLQSPALAGALDSIPQRGDVTEAQFNDYAKAFKAAFSKSSRIGGLAPATRLLAMKRPDFFVCVNGGNRTGLAAALAFAPTTLTLDNYWARVIAPIQQAPWYNTPRPAGRDMDLWGVRVAMLDAIFYQAPPK